MTKNIKQEINKVLSEKEHSDKTTEFAKSLSNLVIQFHNIKFSHISYYGDDGFEAYFDLPDNFRRLTGLIKSVLRIDALVSDNTFAFTVDMPELPQVPPAGSNSVPIENMQTVIKEKIDNYLHMLKTNLSPSYKNSLN